MDTLSFRVAEFIASRTSATVQDVAGKFGVEQQKAMDVVARLASKVRCIRRINAEAPARYESIPDAFEQYRVKVARKHIEQTENDEELAITPLKSLASAIQPRIYDHQMAMCQRYGSDFVSAALEP